MFRVYVITTTLLIGLLVVCAPVCFAFASLDLEEMSVIEGGCAGWCYAPAGHCRTKCTAGSECTGTVCVQATDPNDSWHQKCINAGEPADTCDQLVDSNGCGVKYAVNGQCQHIPNFAYSWCWAQGDPLGACPRFHYAYGGDNCF